MDPQRPKKRPGKVKYVELYDFKRPKLFSKEIMRTLSSIHDGIARSLPVILEHTHKLHAFEFTKCTKSWCPLKIISYFFIRSFATYKFVI